MGNDAALDFDTDMETIRNYVSAVVETKAKIATAYIDRAQPRRAEDNAGRGMVLIGGRVGLGPSCATLGDRDFWTGVEPRRRVQ